MSFTATLREPILKRPDGLKLHIEYNNGVDKPVLKPVLFPGSSDKELKDFARREANNLEKRKDYDPSNWLNKEIDITPEITPPPTPPTAEEIAKEQWFADWAKLKEVNLLMAQAPALATTAHILVRDNLKADVENNWLDNYFGDL